MILRMREKGIPHLNTHGKGDQLVRVNVWIPNKLSAKDNDLLRQLDSSDNVKPREGDTSAHSEKSFFEKVKKVFS